MKTTILLTFSFLFFPTIVIADFCDQKTTEAYHSPICQNNWAVKDPNRIDVFKIQHDPPYHTYSIWQIKEQKYIFSYRDIEYDPNDMEVDIYRIGNSSNFLMATIPLHDQVTGVFTAALTSNDFSDVVFLTNAGLMLKCAVIVKIEEKNAKKVFEYCASEIEIKENPTTILAKSKSGNVIENFLWDEQSDKFIKEKELVWHGRKMN